MSAANGLDAAKALVRIGRRVYIDRDRFEDWVDHQKQQNVTLGVDGGRRILPRASR
jgi:hypothetical protein